MRYFTMERSTERDALLDALLPLVAEHGFTRGAARLAAKAAGMEEADAPMLFPGGPAELVEAWSDLADRRMSEGAKELDFTEKKAPERVRAVIALRFAQQRPHKDAVRRALAVLALPGNAAAAARTSARTANAIWYAAGDSAVDFSWYTKRATLAAVYGATLLAWLRDPAEDDRATLDFLDRRLDGVGRVGAARRRLEQRVESVLDRLRPHLTRGRPS
jgi:ubiquinone biosynthesis protein COQ9